MNKWVACWGNATSITNRREAIYAKDLTLRYPIRMPFSGSMLRFRFSNLTGTEPVELTKVFVGQTPITFNGEKRVTLMPGKETESDAISYKVNRGDTIEVSFYMEGFTQMNSGTLPWIFYLLIGICFCVAALFIANVYLSSFLGVFGASALWGMGELFSHKKRVEKGWCPKNPKRKQNYYQN